MRWSIRNQILVPLIAIQLAAVLVITVTAATLAARRSGRQVVERVHGVIDALGRANFPYTGSVLSKMQGLSGAHFIACDEAGRPLAMSFPFSDDLPASLHAIPRAIHLDSLGRSPTVVLDGTRYLAVRLNASPTTRAATLLVLYPETSWRQARWEAALPPLLLGAVSIALLAGLTSWVAHRISTRIKRVEERVALIAAGDFRELELGREDDEVHDLSRSINRMCLQLRTMRQTIGQSERTRLLAQLAAGLAHQLRNSLTGARMSVQLHARRHPPADDDQSLNVALRQLAMTEEHVKGLLSLGRVEKRPAVLFDARSLLADVAVLVQPSCEHANVTLRHRTLDQRVNVNADEAGIRAALLNLTLNAIEAAGNGGSVSLALGVDESEVVLEVRDTGSGPPESLASSLFDTFVTSKPEGVGLGLALAHQVATEHGGRLSWSRIDGQTCFQLALPRAVESLREAV